VGVVSLPPRFQPLAVAPPIFDTAVLVAAAVIIFAVVAGTSANAGRLYRRIALVALAASFIPDLACQWEEAVQRSVLLSSTWPPWRAAAAERTREQGSRELVTSSRSIARAASRSPRVPAIDIVDTKESNCG
jgi:hypothetical protein